jgi:hypothetical protein
MENAALELSFNAAQHLQKQQLEDHWPVLGSGIQTCPTKPASASLTSHFCYDIGRWWRWA